ncbi:MAG TPA: D-aminoacyl-tRNA deacylase [Myxococcota bacterium]|nr:D-aminoacyl-tRNA deacylase [Myxococcota bacterium]
MRAVVQRVSRAAIRVGGESVGSLERGLLALVGVGRGDGAAAAGELARRIVGLRVFEDEQGRMNRSLLEVGGALGVVSQFTLYGDARRGRRPSFAEAAAPAEAAALLDALVACARELGARVVTGRFQAHMEVELVNAGPVTILLDTDKRF